MQIPSNFNEAAAAAAAAAATSQLDDDELHEAPERQTSVLLECLGNKDYPLWRLYFPFIGELKELARQSLI